MFFEEKYFFRVILVEVEELFEYAVLMLFVYAELVDKDSINLFYLYLSLFLNNLTKVLHQVHC
jgi:hypothetical protein